MATIGFIIAMTLALFLLTLARSRFPSPKMVTREEFNRSLNSAYFSNLGLGDMQARAAQNSREYRDTYVKSLMLFTENEPCIQNLFKLARKADDYCRGHSVPALAALPGIPWRFAILRDDVEGGMPHTHSDVVCLPQSFLGHPSKTHAIRTLIHEKIHVLQRLRKDLTDAFVAAAGYKRVLQRSSLDPAMLSHVRSNPDVDGYIYRRQGACPTIFQLSGRSLSDILSVCLEMEDGTDSSTDSTDSYEHPFEMMAYSLSELVIPLEATHSAM